MDMLEDYFRGLAAKEAEGIMMAKKVAEQTWLLEQNLHLKKVV